MPLLLSNLKGRAMAADLASSPPVSGAYNVDISRGTRIGRVSSEWFSRPGDERYLSLTDLYKAVRHRAELASTTVVPTEKLRVEARRDDAAHLWLVCQHQDTPIVPTHWSFGHLCSQVGAPASYLRTLPSMPRWLLAVKRPTGFNRSW